MSAPQITNYVPYQNLYEAALGIVNLIEKSIEDGDTGFEAFVAAHTKWGSALSKLQDYVRSSSEVLKDRKRFAKQIELARSDYASDDLEIDDFPLLSEGCEGVWISAWVYVATGEDNCLEDADEDY